MASAYCNELYLSIKTRKNTTCINYGSISWTRMLWNAANFVKSGIIHSRTSQLYNYTEYLLNNLYSVLFLINSNCYLYIMDTSSGGQVKQCTGTNYLDHMMSIRDQKMAVGSCFYPEGQTKSDLLILYLTNYKILCTSRVHCTYLDR